MRARPWAVRAHPSATFSEQGRSHPPPQQSLLCIALPSHSCWPLFHSITPSHMPPFHYLAAPPLHLVPCLTASPLNRGSLPCPATTLNSSLFSYLLGISPPTRVCELTLFSSLLLCIGRQFRAGFLALMVPRSCGKSPMTQANPMAHMPALGGLLRPALTVYWVGRCRLWTSPSA